MEPKTLRQIRSTRQKVVVRTDFGTKDVVAAATTRIGQLDSRFNSTSVYSLRYPDGVLADKLPGIDLPFSVKGYKDILMKDYAKMVLFLCPTGMW